MPRVAAVVVVGGVVLLLLLLLLFLVVALWLRFAVDVDAAVAAGDGICTAGATKKVAAASLTTNFRLDFGAHMICV